MKLTASKLRQIIREEAQRMFEYDDADEFPPGTPSYGPDTDHPPEPVKVGQYREFPGDLTPKGVESGVGEVISIQGNIVEIDWAEGKTSYLSVSDVEQNSECTY